MTYKNKYATILLGDEIMTRQPRQLSSTGLYHIVFRGVNRQDIFEDTADYEKAVNKVCEVV